MSELGFWNLAQKQPDALALAAPDGRDWTRGELLAECNQLVHGLRALGLKPGDCVAAVLPNSVEMVQLYLAVAQAGWYLTPINHHLTAPEIAYIVGDCEAKAFFGAERFAQACDSAAREVGLSRDALFALGEVKGFRPFEELKAKKPSVANKLRLAMLVEGVDLMSWPGGLVSATHGEAEIDQTLHAFASALRMLKDEGEI